VTLSLRHLFDAPTIAGLAATIESMTLATPQRPSGEYEEVVL